MDLRQAMLDEHQHESALTRSVLQAIPDSLLDYQATDSSRDVRWNVSHLVDIPSWTDMILREAFFDVAPPGEPPHDTPLMENIEAAIATFDQNVQTATSTIREFDVSTLEDDWSLKLGGQVLLTHSRYMIYRMYLINHVAHHRGHLLVYLRLNGVVTPNLYG